MSSTPQPIPIEPRRDVVSEVRFSLRELLVEVAEERAAGALGAEKLHQRDIQKMFARRAADPRGEP